MTEKVKCKTCDAMIMPSTAERNSGLCMPCKQGNRASIEQSKEFYRQQKEYDPARELWSHLVSKANNDNDSLNSLNSLNSFSIEEKVYFSVNILDGEVYNGGMEQFFSNSSGDFYQEAIEGLGAIGATHSLWLLRRAAKILFDNVLPPKGQEQRWKIMKQYPEDEKLPSPDWAVELDAIDQKYYEDLDDLSSLLAHYAEKTGLITPFLINKV